MVTEEMIEAAERAFYTIGSDEPSLVRAAVEAAEAVRVRQQSTARKEPLSANIERLMDLIDGLLVVAREIGGPWKRIDAALTALRDTDAKVGDANA